MLMHNDKIYAVFVCEVVLCVIVLNGLLTKEGRLELHVFLMS